MKFFWPLKSSESEECYERTTKSTSQLTLLLHSAKYTIEFLDSSEMTGLPPHELNLKVGAIVMLLHNMNVAHGLLNGTRLIVRNMYNNALDLEIITGFHIAILL